MKQTELTIRQLSINNLKRRPFRSACLIFIAALLAFTLAASSILAISLKNGMKSMEQRLGADLMVVPKDYEAGIEGIILKGEPSYFYFSSSTADKIAHIEGVSQVTSQFFLTSLSASCCSDQVQLIGFDPETDFVIQPWIAKSYGEKIDDGQLIAGSDIVLESNHTLKFFNHSYPVAAQLGKTATGLDSSVFANMNTMKELLTVAGAAGVHFISDAQPEDSISSVLVRTDKNFEAKKIAQDIRTQLENVDVIVSKDMITGISDQMGALINYIYDLCALLLVFAIFVLAVVFSVSINERKKEFAVLRILGATRKKLAGMVLTEAFLISVTGAIIGTVVALAVVLPFSTYIGDKLQLPFLTPQSGVLFTVLLLDLVLAIAVGPLTSIYAAAKISRAETYLIMREGE
ncbi:MAG TPA: ABC transporter permease [Syntrophomonas sp.]|nr:ABC transporter permease [Syntrophomonas sp.]